MLEITVYGDPAPQGSKSFKGLSKAGHAILVESSKKVKPWRSEVRDAAMAAMGGAGKGMTGPINVVMTFTMRKPKSAPKARRSWPDKKPDLSKLIRSTEDALTEVGAWEDDARVVAVFATKVFPGEHSESLPVPGAKIWIYSITEQGA